MALRTTVVVIPAMSGTKTWIELMPIVKRVVLIWLCTMFCAVGCQVDAVQVSAVRLTSPR